MAGDLRSREAGTQNLEVVLMKTEKPELVELTVKVPKPIIDYVAALCEFSGANPEEFWTSEIISVIEALVDNYGRPYVEKSQIMEKYSLNKILDC